MYSTTYNVELLAAVIEEYKIRNEVGSKAAIVKETYYSS